MHHNDPGEVVTARTFALSNENTKLYRIKDSLGQHNLYATKMRLETKSTFLTHNALLPSYE